MNRKAFELSINFIVMLILAIVVFGFGLYFSGRLFQQAGEIKASLDKDSESQIRLMLDRGEKVAIPITSRDIKTGQLATFGLGILNVKEADSTNFAVTIVCTSGIKPNQEIISDACSDVGILPDTETVSVGKNKQELIPIAIQIPGSKQKGTYIFTITVKAGNVNYVAPKQIYVNLV